NVPGAQIVSGSTAEFSMKGSRIEYRGDATVRDVNLQQVAEAFNVPALANDRYASNLNGHVTASGTGTTPREMEPTATGRLTNSSILGGRIPELDFEAQFSKDTAHVTADARFAE